MLDECYICVTIEGEERARSEQNARLDLANQPAPFPLLQFLAQWSPGSRSGAFLQVKVSVEIGAGNPVAQDIHIFERAAAIVA